MLFAATGSTRFATAVSAGGIVGSHAKQHRCRGLTGVHPPLSGRRDTLHNRRRLVPLRPMSSALYSVLSTGLEGMPHHPSAAVRPRRARPQGRLPDYKLDRLR